MHEYEVGESDFSKCPSVFGFAAYLSGSYLLGVSDLFPFSAQDPTGGSVCRILGGVNVSPHRMKVGNQEVGINPHDGSSQFSAGAAAPTKGVKDH